MAATGIAVLASVLVAIQLRSRDCQQELARQQTTAEGSSAVPAAETQLRKR